MKDFYRFDSYLVFDPTISTHYEIFKIPRVPSTGFRVLDPMLKSLQWPPSLCVLQVFSSRTRQWGERLFVRDGAVAGTVTDMALAFPFDHYNGVYWHGALYVRCQADFLMRISLSDNKYQVIKLPMNTEVCQYKNHFLGRSMRGVHYALIDNEHRLRVWFLNELYGQMTWELKHDNDLSFLLRCQKICTQNDGLWTLQYHNYFGYPRQNDMDNYYEAYKKHICLVQNHCEDIKKDVVVRVNNFEWDSDNDDILDTANPNEGECHGFLSILEFHPYKEVIFLNQKRKRGLAYHFNSSKVQNLGNSMEEHHDDVTQLLSDDVLADVLARLAPRWLDRRVPLRLQGMARRHRHPPPAPRRPPPSLARRHLPQLQHIWMDLYRFDNYLVFDSTVSPHYEIFQIPRIRSKSYELYPLVKSMPWPPSQSLLQVFSSRTGQ
uniref:F-box associated domain-containing protein n=1 Tax=Oryza meridionalis TaxID=40149 RepID=A0A0E0D4H2_9ORYZ